MNSAAKEVGTAMSLPTKKRFRDMTEKEFEQWLTEHGVSKPNYNGMIPCSVLPYLIDEAISVAHPAERSDLYKQCWEDGQKELKEEICEYGRDRLD